MSAALRSKRALVTGGSRGIGADSLRKLMALPRCGTGDEIAVLVSYLAGPGAGFVTGASLTIDGGFTA
jgi:3-oxoacyl-[acyl-carrier protein] reductase